MPSSIQTGAQIAEHTSAFASPSSRLASWRGGSPSLSEASRERLCSEPGRRGPSKLADLEGGREEMSLFIERGVIQAERELRIFRLLQDLTKKHRSSRL